MDIDDLEDIRPEKDRAPDSEHDEVDGSYDIESSYSYESESDISEEEGLHLIVGNSSVKSKR